MKSARLFIILFSVALSFYTGERNLRSQQPLPSDTLITLKRTDCFLICPEYDVSITADGTVSFEGKTNVRVKGRAQAKISREKVLLLIDMIRKAKFFSLKDKYVDDEDGCRIHTGDAPSAVTSIVLEGKSKSVLHYLGCVPKHKKAGKALMRLENYIDEIANTTQWID